MSKDTNEQQNSSSEKEQKDLYLLDPEWLEREHERKFALLVDDEEGKDYSFEDSLLLNSDVSVEDALTTIKRYQSKIDKPVTTSFDFLDMVCLGGLLPNLIISILARPGHGKTYTAHQLKEDILNSDKDISVLMYNWEMGFFPLLLTNIKKELKISYKDILYKKPTPEQEKVMNRVAMNFTDDRLTMINKALTPTEFRDVTTRYIERNINKEQLFIIVDHIGITKGKNKQSAIYELLEECNALKLKYPNKLTFILLGQLNREIENLWFSGKDLNPLNLRVKSLYVFGADALQQYSDVMMAQVIPQNVGLEKYASVNRKRYTNLEEHFDKGGRKDSSHARLKGLNRIYYDFIKKRLPEEGEPDLFCKILSPALEEVSKAEEALYDEYYDDFSETELNF